ncbi:DNA polymerase III subunit alpha, partial [Agrococcus casei]
MADSFAHLHVHTEYSMLDGAAHIGPLVKAAADMEMPAIAMTDHGNMFGAYEFWKAARGAGVKPIIGTEAYLTPGTNRSDKTRVKWGDQSSNPGDDVSGGGAYTHITMLSETTEGMHNLFRLSSLASLEGYYFKPRMDRELLQRFSKGIIATTGCPSGEIQTRLRLGQYDEAKKAAGEFQDIFGRDNYFLELMDHGLDIERRVRDDLLRLAREVDIPLVASNDLHYTHSHDAKSHDALLCVSTGSTINDPGRFKLDGGGYYLKSPGEMRQLFRELPEACDNTLLIAERCNVEFDESANYMPRYDVPEGESEQSWFIKEVQRGLNERYGGNIPGEVQERANYESEVIVSMGFPGYFLVVADFIEWAKKQGIRVGPGRGSGAGSMAAYSLGITGLDPLEHGLLFERFLNPERVSMPDFDVDFDERRRGEVIRYVTDKYGVDRVAQVVTYGTIKTKQALKDSARVLGHPFGMGEKLTKALPPAVMAKDIPLAGITDEKHERYREAGDFRALIDSDPEAKTVFETAQGLEGLKRQWGVHACAVIMSSEELQRVIPVMKREQDGAIITQFDYPTCESLGLLKMDFLGLRNLTIIDDALDNIESNRGHRPVLEQLDFDDRAAYELLSRGDSLGVFQLDGGPMRSLLRLLKPDNFEDISALIALYRPGPMGANSHTNYALRKNALQEVTPIHAELEEPLKDIIGTTYGLIIYQEQVMAIAQKV